MRLSTVHARLVGVLIVLTGFFLASCESPSRVVGPDLVGPTAAPAGQTTSAALGGGISAHASGGGFFPLSAFDVQFAFTAVQHNTSGEASGNYHFASPDGFLVNIHGRVTCMTTDPANPRRAWMGGEITKNESVHPFFTGENSRVGRDGWFRVVDYGEGANASQPDRTTLIFFEPSGGFSSAQQFCNSRLWFPEDRLTNPLLDGNIHVAHGQE